jgi:hypothetical protein
MHHDYQQLDLQTLIDLLAEETQKYTKAFISGASTEVEKQRVIIDALVMEINNRKRNSFSENVAQSQEGS